MKKIFIILAIIVLFAGCAYAGSSNIEINGIEFEIPSKYHGGDVKGDEYKLDNNFSIRCVDDNVGDAIGLWASENDFSQNLTIGNHPVRHYCQYNKYVNGNHSHAYFASGSSVYEISWTGSQITSDIKKLINNTPESEMDDDAFYSTLDESIDIYKELKKDRLNQDGEYNYLDSKYKSQSSHKEEDDTRFKEILLTYNR